MTDKKICSKADNCVKLKIVIDRDYGTMGQYVEVMNGICIHCKELERNAG